jgi:hypothetical protein
VQQKWALIDETNSSIYDTTIYLKEKEKNENE